jgi:hypothetical protein
MLTEGANYLMTHLRATFHQIYWLVRHTPHIAMCLVSDDKKSITIRGTPVLVSDIPEWYQQLVIKAEAQLDKALCGLKFPDFDDLVARRLPKVERIAEGTGY